MKLKKFDNYFKYLYNTYMYLNISRINYFLISIVNLNRKKHLIKIDI